ncbi:MAG: sporulation protein YqfD [Erysipelotrichaceae bacterium]
MNPKRFGLDQFSLTYELNDFIQLAKAKGWVVYDIEVRDTIYFYTSFLNRNEILTILPSIKLVKTTGFIAFLIRLWKRPERLISILLIIFIWYGLSQTIFFIEIKGEKELIKQKINTVLEKYHYQVPFFNPDMNQMKKQLKLSLSHEIAWLELVKKGSRYVLTYTPKEYVKVEKQRKDVLIAQKDGVIANFSLKHGTKQCAMNDFVHRGDILISNLLVDSTNKNETVFVEGKVFAYTWETIEVTIENSKLPKSLTFFQLLFMARNKVSEDFGLEDKIHKENILQFSSDVSKIKMVVLYTTYVDITTPIVKGG